MENFLNTDSIIKQIKEIENTTIPIANSQLVSTYLRLWKILNLKSVFDIDINIAVSR